MTGYTATVVAFWVAVAAVTLGGCRALDAVTAYVDRCRARRRRHLARTSR